MLKQYRLEVFVASVLASFLVAALWKMLEFASVPYLPFVLLGVSVLPAIIIIISTLLGGEGEHEKYAPHFFGKLFLTSIIGISLFILITIILNRPNFSKTFDLTERKVHSLSDESIKVVKGLQTPVKIICVPEINKASRFCEENEHLMRLFAQANPQKVEIGSVRLNDFPTLQKLAPTGDKRVVMLSDTNRSEITGPITESKLTNGIINLTKGKKFVYFLTGNGEPGIGWDSERNYATLIDFLKKRGYEAKEHKLLNGADLPADAQVLVAGSTMQAYPPFVENMLRKFLARGGKLILSVNPYRELGLTKLLADIGISLEPSILIGDGGLSQLGSQLAQVNPMRPPVALGEFSKITDITGKLSLPYGISDAARPITAVAKDENGLKVKPTDLVSAFASVKVDLSETDRNRLTTEGPFPLKIVPNQDSKRTYKVAFSTEIEGAEKLASDLPPDAPTKVKTQVIVIGFELVPSKYMEPAASTQVEMPLLAISELHQDKDLVSIPAKDFAPKQFRMDRHPESWLPMFAFILPIGTILMGLYIWMRRRSS